MTDSDIAAAFGLLGVGAAGIYALTSRRENPSVPNLTEYEAKAVRVYDEDGSDKINDWLRSEECDESRPVESYREHKGMKKWESDEVTKINRLDEAVDKGQVSTPIILWRGLTPCSKLWTGSAPEVGETTTDAGFLSTTTKETYARGYADASSESFILKIHAKGGASPLRVPNHLVNHGDHIILPRRAKLEVKEVDKKTRTVVTEYTGETAL